MYFDLNSYQKLKELDHGISYSTICDLETMSLDYIVIEPMSVEEPIIHRLTDEIIFVLEGELEGTVNNVKRTIKKGDAVAIKKGVPHSFINKSEFTAKIISVCNPSYTPDDVHKVSGKAVEKEECYV